MPTQPTELEARKTHSSFVTTPGFVQGREPPAGARPRSPSVHLSRRRTAHSYVGQRPTRWVILIKQIEGRYGPLHPKGYKEP